MRVRCASLHIISVFLSTIVAGQSHYYVNPVAGSDENDGLTTNTSFKTLFKARNIVRSVNRNMSADIVVYLEAGLYQLDSTFTLTKEDGGFNGYNVIYQAHNCQTPIISGGVKIDGWSLHDREKNIYKASVDSTIDSRQLYVNGLRAIRARTLDATGWIENGDGYDCPADVANWRNISNVEVVAYSVWKCHRGPIASFANEHVKMAQPYWNNIHVQYNAPPVWIENAYELLDSEGEWYLDRSAAIIYYKPRQGEDMQNAEVVLARQELLLNYVNTQNIAMRGITFAYATWLYPNTSYGFSCHQADEMLSNENWKDFEQMPGNIKLDYCSNIKFISCSFKHLGATAVQLGKGCQENLFYNNNFNDISGSGISIGSLNDSFPSIRDRVINNTIDNNLISNAALEFKGSVGILVGYTAGTKIVHNEIRYLPYTGISLGWGWSNTRTVAANNEVGYNLIDSVMTILQDGGGIYTLSSQAGTHIHHNYIKNELNEHAALYVDEGSSHINFHHNVLSNIYRWINLWSTTSLNDTVAFNYYDNDKNNFSGTNCVAEGNVFVQNSQWPAEAIRIMNNAGRLPVKKCSGDIVNGSDFAIVVYPVPTSDKINIEIKEPIISSYQVQLFNISGNLLQSINKSQFETLATLNLKNFRPGFYFLRITIDKQVYSKKLIKL
jgi:hypothetical protein